MKDLVGRRSYLHDPALHNRVGKQVLEAWNSPYTRKCQRAIRFPLSGFLVLFQLVNRLQLQELRSDASASQR